MKILFTAVLVPGSANAETLIIVAKMVSRPYPSPSRGSDEREGVVASCSFVSVSVRLTSRPLGALKGGGGGWTGSCRENADEVR